MRSDEMLTRATRALREETRGDVEDAAASRRRIVERIGRRSRRRTRASVFVLAFAAVLSASSVWAARGGHIGAVLQRFRHPTSAPDREPVQRTVANEVALQPAPIAQATIATVAETSTVVVVTPPRHTTQTKTHATDHEDDLFAAATHAHFEQHDPSAALAAWDAYLDAAPAGRFALEARYNRALCLLRLGRRSEAIAELSPYANGVHGDYRQHDAARLIAALSHEAP
jgi:hypothetical protein